MKNNSVLKRSILAATIASCLSITSSYAGVIAPTELLTVQPVHIYHAAQGKSLAETLNQLAQRSGITFKIGIDLSSDTVQQNIAASDWTSAVKELLTDYNYSLIQDGKQLKTVIITGRNHSSNPLISLAPTSSQSQPENTIEFSRTYKELPQKYRAMPAGAVTAIQIPVKQMLDIKDNSVISLDLPIGNYAVNHDNTVDGQNGMQTWVGHLDNEGEGYRVYVSQGSAGIMGVINTPDGTYHIEQTEGNTYLIDTNQLSAAGFVGDQETSLPTALMEQLTAKALASANSISAASTATIDQLKATVATDQIALAAAQTTVTNDQAALSKAQTALTNALAAFNTATTNVATATTTKNNALTAETSASALNTQTLAAETAALTAVNAEKAKLNADTTALNNAQTAFNTIKAKEIADLANVNNLKAKLTAGITQLISAITAKIRATSALSAAESAAKITLNNLTAATNAKNSAASTLATASTVNTTAQTALLAAQTAVTNAKNALANAKTSTAIATANAALISANNNLTTEQSAYTLANTAYNTALANATKANSAYTLAVSANATAQSQVNTEKAAMTSINATYSSDLAAYYADNYAFVSAQKTYNADVVAYNAANATLTTATANFNKDQATYNSLSATYSTTLRAYQNAAAAYSNATAALASANSALSTANQQLTSATAAYNTALSTVNTAQSALNAANTALATAQTNYNAAVAALKLAEAPSTNTTTTSSSSSGSSSINANITNTIDIMVLYTTIKQTQAYALQRIQLLTTMSNQAYIDSKINLAIRLVHTEPTTYVENNSNNQALSDMVNNMGVFAGLSTKRAKYGADLVYLFRPLYVNATGNCGLSYVEFASGSTPNAAVGFGTMGDGNSVDATGYYCGVNTFTHEIGHGLGLVHDRADANGYGATPYSYAWSNQGVFATIMSYQTPMLMLFSTPLLTTQCAGQPCGYPASDTARASDQTSVVNITAPQVAKFMPTTITKPVLQ